MCRQQLGVLVPAAEATNCSSMALTAVKTSGENISERTVVTSATRSAHTGDAPAPYTSKCYLSSQTSRPCGQSSSLSTVYCNHSTSNTSCTSSRRTSSSNSSSSTSNSSSSTSNSSSTSYSSTSSSSTSNSSNSNSSTRNSSCTRNSSSTSNSSTSDSSTSNSSASNSSASNSSTSSTSTSNSIASNSSTSNSRTRNSRTRHNKGATVHKMTSDDGSASSRELICSNNVKSMTNTSSRSSSRRRCWSFDGSYLINNNRRCCTWCCSKLVECLSRNSNSTHDCGCVECRPHSHVTNMSSMVTPRLSGSNSTGLLTRVPVPSGIVTGVGTTSTCAAAVGGSATMAAAAAVDAKEPSDMFSTNEALLARHATAADSSASQSTADQTREFTEGSRQDLHVVHAPLSLSSGLSKREGISMLILRASTAAPAVAAHAAAAAVTAPPARTGASSLVRARLSACICSSCASSSPSPAAAAESTATAAPAHTATASDTAPGSDTATARTLAARAATSAAIATAATAAGARATAATTAAPAVEWVGGHRRSGEKKQNKRGGSVVHAVGSVQNAMEDLHISSNRMNTSISHRLSVTCGSCDSSVGIPTQCCLSLRGSSSSSDICSTMRQSNSGGNRAYSHSRLAVKLHERKESSGMCKAAVSAASTNLLSSYKQPMLLLDGTARQLREAACSRTYTSSSVRGPSNSSSITTSSGSRVTTTRKSGGRLCKYNRSTSMSPNSDNYSRFRRHSSNRGRTTSNSNSSSSGSTRDRSSAIRGHQSNKSKMMEDDGDCRSDRIEGNNNNLCRSIRSSNCSSFTSSASLHASDRSSPVYSARDVLSPRALVRVPCLSDPSESQQVRKDNSQDDISGSDLCSSITSPTRKTEVSRMPSLSHWHKCRSGGWSGLLLLLIACMSLCSGGEPEPLLPWPQHSPTRNTGVGVFPLLLLLLTPATSPPTAAVATALSAIIPGTEAAAPDSSAASLPDLSVAATGAVAGERAGGTRLLPSSASSSNDAVGGGHNSTSDMPAASGSGTELSSAAKASSLTSTAVASDITHRPAAGSADSFVDTDDKDKSSGGPPLDALGLPVKEKVYRAKLYGSMFSYAYYFLDILVGTPPQRASVILDTGSSLLAFPCKGCTDCGEHLDPAIDTGLTTTGEWVGCTEKERCFGTCSGDAIFKGKLRNEGRVGSRSRCMYSQTYSEGSSIKGIYMSDVVALGELEQKNPFVRYDFVVHHSYHVTHHYRHMNAGHMRMEDYMRTGCHVEETNLFVTQKAAGIFGISFPKGHRQPTLLDVMFQHNELVDRKLFSICISEDGGLLTVGGYEPSLLVAPPEAAPSTPATMFPWPAAAGGGDGGSGDSTQSSAPRAAAEARNTSVYGERTPENIGAAHRSAEGLTAAIAAEQGKKTSPHYADLIGWTPIISHSTYRVLLERMEIEGLVLGHDREEFGNTMVDSGTTYSYFPPAVFARWRQFLHRLCTPELFCERERDGRLCWRVSPGTDLTSVFPPIKVVFGYSAAAAAAAGQHEQQQQQEADDDDGKSTQPREQVVWWRPEGYLYRRTGGYYCDGFDDNRVEASVLGLSFFKNKLVIFDREHDRVGFAAAQCPSFYVDQRPPGPTDSPRPMGGTASDAVRSPASSQVKTRGEEGQLEDEEAAAMDAADDQEPGVSRLTLSAFSRSLPLRFEGRAVWVLVGGFILAIVFAMAVILYNTSKLHSLNQVVPVDAEMAPITDASSASAQREGAIAASAGSGRFSGGASIVSNSSTSQGAASDSAANSSRSRGTRVASEARKSDNIRQVYGHRVLYQTTTMTPRATAASRAAAAAKAAATATTRTAAKAGSQLSQMVQRAAGVSAGRLVQHRISRHDHQHVRRQRTLSYTDVESAQPFSALEDPYYDMEEEGDTTALVDVLDDDGVYSGGDRGITTSIGNETRYGDTDTDEEQGLCNRRGDTLSP